VTLRDVSPKKTLSEKSLVGIPPLTAVALAASLLSSHNIEPVFAEPAWPQATPETDFDIAQQSLLQGIKWTSSDTWFVPIRASVYDLLSLAENWDLYGAAQVKQEFVASAADLLRNIMDEYTPAPAIVPTTPGGVQIEWHTNGIDLEIEVESTSRINVWYEDSRTGISWEDELSSDLRRLSDIVAMLSRRAGERA
jgi:hypothetical protein